LFKIDILDEVAQRLDWATTVALGSSADNLSLSTEERVHAGHNRQEPLAQQFSKISFDRRQ
jgi:hypothetical protein